jgi:hypothetical protein
MRGNSYAVVQAISCGEPEELDRLLEPLRALGPVMDTFRVMSMSELSHLHMDPEHPVPGAGDGSMLSGVDDETIDVLVEGVVGKPILGLEVRHLGGAIARASADHGAVSSFEAPFIMFAVGIAPTPELKVLVQATVEALLDELAPWRASHTYLNFAESRRDARTLWTEAAYRRLKRIKQAVDPAGVIRSNHPL